MKALWAAEEKGRKIRELSVLVSFGEWSWFCNLIKPAGLMDCLRALSSVISVQDKNSWRGYYYLFSCYFPIIISDYSSPLPFCAGNNGN